MHAFHMVQMVRVSHLVRMVHSLPSPCGSYTFRAGIFGEQIFTILAANHENKFHETYKILNNRENLFC